MDSTQTQKLASPLDMLFYRERTTPRKKFLVQPDNRKWTSYSWEEVGQEVRTMATYLRRCNFEKGSRIAIYSRNSAHWLMADWAIWLAGYVSVPLYPNLTSESVNKILTHAEVKLVFVGSVVDWQEARLGIPPETELVALPNGGPDNLPQWTEVKRSSLPMSSARVPDLDDLATIIYTSGTTGEPKGVMHSFRSIAFAGSRAVKEASVSPDDRMISYLPLSHVAERLLTEANVLYSGATIYFCESLTTFLSDVQYAKPTIFLGVPRVWEKIRSQINSKLGEEKVNRLTSMPVFGNAISFYLRKRLGLHKCRLLLTGAAPLAKEVQNWFAGLGMPLLEAYGMSENFAYSHLTLANKMRVGWVGAPLPGVETRIAEDGELLVRSPSMMRGYYQADELTAETVDADGWLHTGDLAVIDEKTKELRITGRKKDIFKTSKGKYVAPVPIEEKLAESNYFEQICVVGAGLPQPVAIVRVVESHRNKTPSAMKRDLEKVRKTVNSLLDRHEQLGRIAVIDEEWTVENGVLTPTMKIKRNVVESRFEQAAESWSSSKAEIVFVDSKTDSAN